MVVRSVDDSSVSIATAAGLLCRFCNSFDFLLFYIPRLNKSLWPLIHPVLWGVGGQHKSLRLAVDFIVCTQSSDHHHHRHQFLHKTSISTRCPKRTPAKCYCSKSCMDFSFRILHLWFVHVTTPATLVMTCYNPNISGETLTVNIFLGTGMCTYYQ